MKEKYLIILMSLILAVVIQSCTESDATLYGTWKLNREKSTDLVTWRYRQLQLEILKNENDVIIAFGIGRAPENATIPTIKKRLASRGALVVATAWIGRLAVWSKKGIESPFDVSANVIGVSTIYQTWIGEQFMLLKVEAPLEANLN